MNDQKKPSRSLALAVKLIYAALSILRDSGKEMRMRDLLAKEYARKSIARPRRGNPCAFRFKKSGPRGLLSAL